VRNPLRRAITLAVSISGLCLLPTASSALASTQQLSMFEDDVQLQSNPEATLNAFRALGVGIARVYVSWRSIAPSPDSGSRPAGDLSNPAAYPGANWAIYDRIVRAAAQRSIAVDLTLSAPAPQWALGAGAPAGAPLGVWKPSASEFGKFVHAVATRYSGHYGGLPRVGTWAIWNEPNFGKDVGPQAVNRSTVLYSPVVYRGLVDAAWRSFQATGHGHDTILIGSLAARGANSPPRPGVPEGLPGNFATTKPLQFIRTLYCVDSRLRPLRGSVASITGCPKNGAATRRFRSAHPGLFNASGFADHPYPINQNPTRAASRDPDYAEFNELPRLETLLDKVLRVYGSHKRYPIYVTEYGYVTNPPNRSNHYVSPATAAFYDNWAEYLSWRQPRIATSMQYLLIDPNPSVNVPEFGGFASGLEYFGGVPKSIGGGLTMLDSYRLALFTPVTSVRRGRQLEVWGDVRPAHYARLDTGRAQSVQIQIQPNGSGGFLVAKTIMITNPRGYFDTKVAFAKSGPVRLMWTPKPGATPTYSRSQRITVH
jgi:hypothetical protein